MRHPIYKKKFEKDFKRVLKRGYDVEKLKTVINTLIQGKPLDKKYLDEVWPGFWSKWVKSQGVLWKNLQHWPGCRTVASPCCHQKIAIYLL
jgi:mRNA-degrading endonuclease YafQ of YafQ-DinJ toxin-antitoxin module